MASHPWLTVRLVAQRYSLGETRPGGAAMPDKTELEKLTGRAAAERIATSEGLIWKNLPAEERRARRRSSLDQVTDADRATAAAMLARRRAK